MGETRHIVYKVEPSLEQFVRFHTMFHLYMNGISVSDGEMDILVLLAIRGRMGLMAFCNQLVKSGVFKTTQCVRNAIGRLEAKGDEKSMPLLSKIAKDKKKPVDIEVCSQLRVNTGESALLDIKMLYKK